MMAAFVLSSVGVAADDCCPKSPTTGTHHSEDLCVTCALCIHAVGFPLAAKIEFSTDFGVSEYAAYMSRPAPTPDLGGLLRPPIV